MTGSRPRTLVLLALLGAAVAVSLARILQARGLTGMPLPWTIVLVPVAAAVAIVWFAWPVRRWKAGLPSRRFTPLRAARTVVLAKAASAAGALLGGWYTGQGLWALTAAGIEAQRGRAVVALLAAAGCVLLLISGLIVQRWCRRPPEDEAGPDGWPGPPPRGTLGS